MANNFVYNTTAVAPTASLPALNFPKTDLNPVTGDATKYVAAADWNLVNQACYDLRGAILQGTLFGYATQASRPSAIANTTYYTWLDNTATPNLHFWDGTNDNLLAGAPVTAKGDIAVYNGTNWVKLAVGTNTQVLTADSTQASGIKWAAGGGGGSVVGLSAAYNGGAVAADQTMLIQSGKGGPAIFKANAAGTGSLLLVQTSGGSTFANFSDGAVTATVAQPAATSGVPIALSIAGGAHTGLTASTEATDINFNLARTVQWATGALTTQRAALFQAPTYSFVGASTITDAATLDITGPPVAGTNATITNPWALRIEAGNVGMAAGSSLKNTAQGATNTDGITISSNVADGASSRGLVLQSSSTITNGKNISIVNGASEIAYFGQPAGATYWEWRGVAAGNLGIRNANQDGFFAITNHAYLYVGGTVIGDTVSTGLLPGADISFSSGSSARRWTQSWSRQFNGVEQTVAAAATLTLDPASGESVRLTLSATAINAAGIAAGTGNPGEVMRTEFIQDATGGRTLTQANFSTSWVFAGGSYTVTSTANKRDIITWMWDTVASKWYEIARTTNL